MQNQQYLFNGKTYTTVSGLKSAQRAWVGKNLPELAGKMLAAPGGLKRAKVENYLPSGVLLSEYKEEAKKYVRAVFMGRLYFRVENRIALDWCGRDRAKEFAMRHVAAELKASGIPFLSSSEKNELIEWATALALQGAKARYHAAVAAKLAEGAEAAPARRNNTPKRVRKNRDKKPSNVKGKKQRK